MTISFTGFFGFWIFLAVFFALDCFVFISGYDSICQKHRTEQEKQLQQVQIEINRAKAMVLALKVKSARGKFYE